MRDVSYQTLCLRKFRPRNQGGGAPEDSRTYVVRISVSLSSSRRMCTKSIQWNSYGNLEVFRGIFCTLSLYPRVGVRGSSTQGLDNPSSLSRLSNILATLSASVGFFVAGLSRGIFAIEIDYT
ncbi:hypothetical protein GIB67_017876 [Kingdonia uniflora]|uniref:Uncharacterized protein n=1 Tax=Kingdonia uniflora TaxID=39325 RepID=A0A7J7MKW5_9MAGN|nr:hypothetical protein GIB67_017876 [Kingdonia uniflora]